MNAGEIARDIEQNGKPGRSVMYTGRGMEGEKIHDSNDTELKEMVGAEANPDPEQRVNIKDLHRSQRRGLGMTIKPNMLQELPCLGGCDVPIKVAPGQRIYSHGGKCRTEFKKRRKSLGL